MNVVFLVFLLAPLAHSGVSTSSCSIDSIESSCHGSWRQPPLGHTALASDVCNIPKIDLNSWRSVKWDSPVIIPGSPSNVFSLLTEKKTLLGSYIATTIMFMARSLWEHHGDSQLCKHTLVCKASKEILGLHSFRHEPSRSFRRGCKHVLPIW